MGAVWDYLNDRWVEVLLSTPRDQLAVNVTAFVHEGCWILTNVPYTLLSILQIPFFEKYKIQKGKAHTPVTEVLYMAFIVFIQQVLFLAPSVYITQGLFTFDWSAKLPHPLVILSQILFCVFCEDLSFYGAHRLLHVPWFYQRFHKQHHYYNAPFSWMAEYAHPVEVFFSNYLPVMLGPFLLQIHVVSWWSWLFFRIYLTTEAHCGYNFPWNVERWLPFYAGPAHHDRHHEAFNGNFGSSLKVWDFLFGTRLRSRQERVVKKEPVVDAMAKEE